MTTVFSEFDAEALALRGATHTVTEILGQPGLWEDTASLVAAERPALAGFLQTALANPARSLVLTGAGSSAFIGELLQGPLALALGRPVRAIPTTDLVTHPEAALAPGGPVLLVSFARSGNSPESVAALDRVDALLGDVHHLIITCAPEGLLARHPSRNPKRVLAMPARANDRSLAMTGSFTSMALAGLLLGTLRQEVPWAKVQALAAQGRALLAQGDLLRQAGALDFHRAIVLGSGPKLGAARESQLKLQELTAGRSFCGFDSFLGLRHGPKAAIDPGTLLIFLLAADPLVRRYEDDLLGEIDHGERGIFRLGVGAGSGAHLDGLLTLGDPALDDAWLAIPSVLAGQILGVYRSLANGLKPDAPSPTGAISRVVQGVTIYPHPSADCRMTGEGDTHGTRP
jgi:tagatose-6-phosphate ketose/aldose isomerase